MPPPSKSHARRSKTRGRVALSAALRDELLFGLAHDLSTLQAALQLQAQLLSASIDRLEAVEGGPPGVTDVQANASKLAETSALVGEFARDFIEVCRGHCLAVRLQGGGEKSFLLAELLAQARMVFKPRAAQRGLTLHVAPATACLLQGDSLRIQRVLFNLLDNALKFTCRGQVRVEAGWSRAGGLRLMVADTGAGLAATRSRRAGAPGFGLGLGVVKRVAHDLGGTLDVASDACGTRAVVQLPLRGALLEASEGGTELRGARVLLLSDDVWVAHHDASLLRARGASVLAVSQTRRHLQLLSAWRPSAVVAHLSAPRPPASALVLLRQASALVPLPLYVIADPRWVSGLGALPVRRPHAGEPEAPWDIEETIEGLAADVSACEQGPEPARRRPRASRRARPSPPPVDVP